ncbi:hypothetical protein [Burkholderia sp. Ac-20379]|uniref:hypothetical protein n=1 Tax=Burkholderia sp. Ac-20379 TaxID=2703900 RepID=UPI00197D3606|nr:hypothetical protein [Burkholderia sp. Ac-20379]
MSRLSHASASNDCFAVRTIFARGAGWLPALALLAAAGVQAQSAAQVSGVATIGANAARDIGGVLKINETVGTGNAQANQLGIAIGTAAGASLSSLQVATSVARTGDTAARIEGGALSNLSGAAMVNQSAGSANLQRNSMAIGSLGAGIEAVSDTELSETASKAGGLGNPAGGRGMREVSISGDAFKHISGIVQVNQTAGAGNTTANSFVLRPPAGTLFIN